MPYINIPGHSSVTIKPASEGVRLVNPSGKPLTVIAADLDGGALEILPAKVEVKHRRFEAKGDRHGD